MIPDLFSYQWKNRVSLVWPKVSWINYRDRPGPYRPLGLRHGREAFKFLREFLILLPRSLSIALCIYIYSFPFEDEGNWRQLIGHEPKLELFQSLTTKKSFVYPHLESTMHFPYIQAFGTGFLATLAHSYNIQCFSGTGCSGAAGAVKTAPESGYYCVNTAGRQSCRLWNHGNGGGLIQVGSVGRQYLLSLTCSTS